MKQKISKTIYQKYSPLQIKALKMFISVENGGNVKDLCPDSYASQETRQEFYDLMQAFVALNPVDLDGVDFDEINADLQDGTLIEPMAHQAQDAVRLFIDGFMV